MQSHDAEFSDHGRTPIPQGANHYLEGASKSKGFTPEQLDREAERLIANGDDMAISLDAKLQKAAEAYMLAQDELRDLARMSLSENPRCKNCGSQEANHNWRECQLKKCKGHYPTESGLTFGDSLQPTFCEGECERPNSSADADDKKCEGHYDDDTALLSGAAIGEATFCDGRCVN